MAAQAQGNPAVVGLAGFGATTLLLQFHNLGLCHAGVVFCLALAFGGMAQLIAGFQEFNTGNNFGFCAFTAYGAFWIALGAIFFILECETVPGQTFVHEFLKITPTDVGWFMVTFTAFTFILLIGSLAIHTAMFLTFLTLVIGFIGLDAVFLAGMKQVLTITAIDLIACALLAWYMMAHVIFLQVFGKNVLPVGAPLIGKPQLAAKAA
ncbi:MAG: acetate uptake transporter [Syntrophobacteraceae bacterium]|nr:acetate uptake transporter [Syntrophobacteraceae bacterium]